MKAWLRHLPAVLGLALLGGAIYVVLHEFRSLKLADIKAALAAIPSGRLWAALGWTLLAYAILTIYDRLATIYAGRAVSYARAAFASFCAYTLAHNLGFAAVSGAAVRYRLYAHWGLTPLQIGKVVAFCSLTFILGGLVLGGAVLLLEPEVLPVLGSRLPGWMLQAIGAALFACAALYVVLSRLVGHVRLFGHEVELPSWRMAIAQTALATIDVVVTAAIGFVLLPEAPGLTFFAFLGVYVASYTAGLLANVPGGLGVFDTAMLLGLSPWLDAPTIVGAIVVFRLYYYIVPLFLAGALFAGNEMLLRGRGLFAGTARLHGVQTIGRWSQPDFEVAAVAGAVALCGTLLLALGAIGALGDYSWIGPAWSLPGWAEALFNPGSEFVPSLIGAALLVLSIALTRRVTLAWGLTIALLLLGAAFTAVRGEHFWIPALLLGVAALLAPFRRLFYRHARLLSGPIGASRAIAPLLLVGSVVVLASYEPRLTLLAKTSWWQVVLSPALPNSVRASVALAVLVALVAIWRLVRPGRVTCDAWDEEARRRYRALGGTAPEEAPGLHFDGLLWGEAGRAAIPFRRVGGVLLGFGDPAGAPSDRVSAIWRLRDLAMQEGLDPAIWRAGPALLPVYADIGLAALPLDSNGLPRADDEAGGDASWEGATAPHASEFLVCVAERDLPILLPLLPALAVAARRGQQAA